MEAAVAIGLALFITSEILPFTPANRNNLIGWIAGRSDGANYGKAVVYDFPKGLPKIHEHDGKPARGFGIFIGNRLAVYYTWSSDLGNGWEDVGTYATDPAELHEQALRMGVNLFTYAVTSRPAS
mgnify:CR=1 FL=1